MAQIVSTSQSNDVDDDAPFEGFGPKLSKKKGGIHKGDPEGGVYEKLGKEGKKYLIKRDDQTPMNDIAEYLGSRIFKVTSPGSGCKIHLVKSKRSNNTFLASKYFGDEYRDFWKEMGHKKRHVKTGALIKNTNKCIRKFTNFPEIPTVMKKALLKKNADGQYKYTNYEQIIVSSLLIDDFSIHSGNIGVVNDGEKFKLVRIDFGAAFRRCNPEIKPLKSIRNRCGLEKNHLVRDHPEERRLTEEFSSELKRVSKIKLRHVIESSFHVIFKNYDFASVVNFSLRPFKKLFKKYCTCAETNSPQFEELKKFLEFSYCRVYLQNYKNNDLSIIDAVIEEFEIKELKKLIISFFIRRMRERQRSLRNIATEIDIHLSGNDEHKMDKIVGSNETYCDELLKHLLDDNNKRKSIQLKIKYPKDTIASLTVALERHKKGGTDRGKTKDTSKSSRKHSRRKHHHKKLRATESLYSRIAQHKKSKKSSRKSKTNYETEEPTTHSTTQNM